MAMALSSLSLILLFTGADSLPLQKRSDTSQQPAWCRDPRPKSSSASPCNEDDKEHRFFLHKTNPRGCKRFGICPDDAAKYDLLSENNYFLSFEECQRSCMEHVQCPELPIGDNMTVVSDNGLQGWGRRVVFECNAGYSFSGNSNDRTVRTCQKNGTWSGLDPVCLRQCEAPPTVRHADIAPVKPLHSQGGTIHYTCEVGYELNGSAERTCGEDGEWTGEEPTCRCQGQASDTDECTRCPEPSPVEHGELLAPNRSLFAEIKYTCYPGFTVVGSPTRVCQENGQWSGEQPTCWNLSILMTQGGDEEPINVTNRVVDMAIGSSNIKFTAVSSTPNPFEDMTPVWTFDERDGELPFAVSQSDYSLTFTSILKTREQNGNYSFTLGNFTIGFQLHVLEAEEEDIPAEGPQKVITDAMTTTENTAKFLCIVQGVPVPKIEWYRNEQLLTNGGRIRIDNTETNPAISIMTISNISEDDYGVYVCRAENRGGNASWPVEIPTRRKRSIENSEELVPCKSESSDTVTLIGRVKAQVRQTESLQPSYRVHVKRFIRGSTESKTRRIRVVSANELLAVGSDDRLRLNTDYVLEGQLINKTLFVPRNHVFRHTPEVESHIASWC